LASDKDILWAVADGNESAFRLLVDQWRDKVYSVAMYLTRSEILSEDIVQETFIKVWENRSQLKEINFFSSWIRTIVRNTCLNYLRSVATEKLALAKLAGHHIYIDNTEDPAIAKEYDQMLQKAINTLPKRQQEVYLLHRMQGLKHEQIARQLGISVFTVKEHMRMALRSIRSSLENYIELSIIVALAIYLPA